MVVTLLGADQINRGIMYFPKNFNLNRSIELAKLISYSYDQYSCFDKNTQWSLPGKYKLLSEIFYTKNSRLNDIIESSKSTPINILGNISKINIKIPVGYIAKNGTDVFIIFRGTLTATEWINNLNTKLCNYFIKNYGSVHEGFLNSYINMREDITDTLKSISGYENIYIAGHSLGGAFATLAMPDLEINEKRHVAAIYTYGSPRIGDSIFVQNFNKSYGKYSFRIANTSDFITSIPLPMPIAGFVGGYFSHIDTPVNFTFQDNNLENNHKIDTYLTELVKEKRNYGIE